MLPTLIASALALAAQSGPSFDVRFTEGAGPATFSGRVLVFLSKTLREPRTWTNWARLEPVIAADFRDVRPGTAMVLDGSNALSFPVPLADLEGGRYRVQAVLDLHRDQPFPGLTPGNPCSAPLTVELHPAAHERTVLLCDQRVPATELHETRHAHAFQVRSSLLSEFHGRTVLLRALVHLPEAWYEEPERRFPVHVFLSGFGARLEDFAFVDWPAAPLDGVPMVMVYPDPSCASGYCGFADSDNNGPWGRAFLEELLPAIEQEYRCLGTREARFLAGHSSGAWSALWLMVNHPGVFGYAWANSPDPVDFRDFLGVDLYGPDANLFFDELGELRPFCQLGNIWPVGFTKEYSDRERILRGGVLGAFEALFGPRGADGTAAPLWDRETGAVRPEVARSWSRFDIGRILRERWPELAPELDGRLSITMGDRDNFLLQGSVALLKRELEARGADVRIELLAGDHFSVRSHDRSSEEVRRMAAVFRAWQATAAEPRTPAAGE